MKKKLMVQVQNGGEYTHFDAILKEDGVKLKHAPSSEWTDLVKGKVAVSLKNNGNGVDVLIHQSFDEDPKHIQLDYCELEYLRIALHLYETDREKIFGNPKHVSKLRKYYGG